MSSLNLPPEAIQMLLQDPQQLMGIMKRCANSVVTEAKEKFAHEIEKDLDEEDARCKQEAQLPLRRPAPTQLTDLEL